MSLLRRCAHRLLAAIPSDCALCLGASRGGRLCQACEHDTVRSMSAKAGRCRICALALGAPPHCPDCGQRAPAFDGVWAAFDYAGPGEVLITDFKLRGRLPHARLLAELIADAIDPGRLDPATILVPVPSSRASLIRRGFNPAAELARCLSVRLGLRMETGLVLRAHDGRKQSTLSRSERLQDTRHLFRCTRAIGGVPVAVVDDVMTTGSTLHGMARQLKGAGASSVRGLVAARTPYRY